MPDRAALPKHLRDRTRVLKPQGSSSSSAPVRPHGLCRCLSDPGSVSERLLVMTGPGRPAAGDLLAAESPPSTRQRRSRRGHRGGKRHAASAAGAGKITSHQEIYDRTFFSEIDCL